MSIRTERHRESDLRGLRLRWIVIGITGLLTAEVWPIQDSLIVTSLLILTNLVATFLCRPKFYRSAGLRMARTLRLADVLCSPSLLLWSAGGRINLVLIPAAAILVDGIVTRNAKRSALISLATGLVIYEIFDYLSKGSRESISALLIIGVAGIVGVALGAFGAKEEALKVNGRRLATLLDCSAAISTSQDIRETMLYALKKVINDFGASAGYINLVSDDEASILKTEVAYSSSGQFEFPEKVEMGGGLSGYVASNGQPVALRENGDEGIDCDGISTNIQSVVSVPLINPTFSAPGQASSGEALGAITILSDRSSQGSDLEELEFLQGLSSVLAIAVANNRMEERQRSTFLRTMQGLATALEARDDYTRGHSQRVCDLSLLLGAQLGFGHEALEELRIGTILHDIGKIGVPDAILNKPGRLTDDEFERMKQHPVIGFEICKPLQLSEGVLMIIRNHHEKLDGTGYPDGLKGGELPLALRIVCVADAFDAMSSRRPYRGVMDIKVVVSELSKGAGQQFDPVVVETLKQLLAAGRLDPIYRKFWKEDSEAA